MTTVSYLISSAEHETMEPHIILVVENHENLDVDSDKLFFDAMTRSGELGQALQRLLSATRVDGRPVFRPHIRNVTSDYQVECVLLGDCDVGMLPPMDTRMFSVHQDGLTAQLGDAIQVLQDNANGTTVEQHLAYLDFVSADRKESVFAR
jgi:hypothetical protein